MKAQWNSLTELRDYLVKNDLEQIRKFTGWQLITDRCTYTLVLGRLEEHPHKKSKKL